jgi:hypothetical protein
MQRWPNLAEFIIVPIAVRARYCGLQEQTMRRKLPKCERLHGRGNGSSKPLS